MVKLRWNLICMAFWDVWWKSQLWVCCLISMEGKRTKLYQQKICMKFWLNYHALVLFSCLSKLLQTKRNKYELQHPFQKGISNKFWLQISKSQYFFSNLNSNCSNLLDLRNLQEKGKKHSVIKNFSDLSLFE